MGAKAPGVRSLDTDNEYSAARMKGGGGKMALVPLEEILSRVENVYEAVIIAAKEARRINEQRLVAQDHLSENEESEEEEDRDEEKEPSTEMRKEEKVTVQALKKLVTGRIGFSYEDEQD